MPLIDLQWALSAINEKNLEQAGIIANFFAGILLAVEYLITKEKIDQINDSLEHHISNAYSTSLKMVKAYAKWNRRIIFIIIAVIILIALYQTIFQYDASVRYFFYYYNLVKPVLIPLRRILLASLAVISIMFVLLFIGHSAPKKILGALAILLYIIGNILLYLHTLFR
jgi:Na+/melibiose symporter-like transporter